MKFVSKDNLNSFSAKIKTWVKNRKIKASDLDSGSATQGQVATADGQGGVTYTNAPGGGVTSIGGQTGAITLGNGLSMSGNEMSSTGITQTEADGRYLQLSGGTMTGSIALADGVAIRNSNNHNLVRHDDETSTVLISNNLSITKIQTSVFQNLIHRRGNNDYDVLDSNNTKANPTLAGTEADLTGLKVNGTSYKVSNTYVSVVDWS